MFLFPKSFATEAELNSSNIVLVHKSSNIRVTIPLRSSISLDKDNCILASEDEFQKIDLSENDLKSLHSQFISLLEEQIDELFSPESHFIDQDESLNKLKELHLPEASNSLMEQINNTFPTKSQLMTSSDFIVRVQEEIIPTLKKIEENNETQLSNSYNPSFNKLPKILRENLKEVDLSTVRLFATEFKNWRLQIGLSQKDVVTSIELILKKKFSQTTLCRFENARINFCNMRNLIPYFRKWLKKIYKTGVEIVIEDIKQYRLNAPSSDGIDSEKEENVDVNIIEEDVKMSSDEDELDTKNRVKRVVFSKEQRTRLENLFQTVKLTQITTKVYEKYGRELNLDPKKIMTWMCKRRREQRKEEQIKKRKTKR